MQRWLTVGALILLISVSGIVLVDSVPQTDTLPGAEQLLEHPELFLSSNGRNWLDFLRRTYQHLPADVSLLIVTFLVAGLATNLFRNPPNTHRPPLLNPAAIGLSGTVLWIFASFGSALAVSRMPSVASLAPITRIGLAGITQQTVLLIGVVLAWPMFRNPGNNHPTPPLPDTHSYLQGLKTGLFEFLRLYPFMFLGLFLNEYLVVESSSMDLPVSYRLIGMASALYENLLLFVLIGVAAPVVEELFFRGVFFAALRSLLTTYPAALLGGGFFALVHFEYQLFLPLWIFGTALCLIYERSGSIKVVITMHFLQNTVSFYMLKRLMV